jgi:hypothetical protein
VAVKRTYAGIGSRRTPQDVCVLMAACGRVFGERGWTLRSGAADGADEAFETGAMMSPTRPEIYLPWRNFNGHDSADLDKPSDEAYGIARKYHPRWQYLKPPVRSLLARDAHQVLGRNLDDPVTMIVCWTPDGTMDGEGPDSGGTGMALRIARGEAPDVIVFNLAIPAHRARIEDFVS